MPRPASLKAAIAVSALIAQGCYFAPLQARNPHAASVPTPAAGATESVAQLQGQSFSLGDLDAKGGRAIYDAQDQLYQARVRALYQWLSDELLDREAKAEHQTVDQLLEAHVNSVVPMATDAEVMAFVKERTGNSDIDPPRKREAAMYLTLKRRAEKKREYVQTLFDTYHVKVTLASPPAPPAEEIRGAMDPMLGNAAAPVTVVVFSDYLCPYCRDLSSSLTELLKRYPKEVRIVYRQFPIHPGADQLASASLCAADQGQFAAFHNLLFASPAPNPSELDDLARKAGLDVPSFSACVKNGIHQSRVNEDVQEGQRLLIQGTPTLFVQGLRLRGSQSVDQLSARVEEALHVQHGATASATATFH
jgi:protein-disulfide isomerase